MNRPYLKPLSGALAACVLSAATLFTPFAAAPAHAADGGSYYRAELASPLAEPRQEILNGVRWRCEGTSCLGTRGGSRSVIVCGRLANRVGEVTSFADPNGIFDEDDLARCNG